MTASLYQSGSSLESVAIDLYLKRLFLSEIVEIALGRALAGLDAERVRRAFGRRERHEDTRALPLIALAREQLVREIRVVRVERPFVERYVDEAALRVLRVQVHDDEDDVLAVPARLGVADEPIVVDLAKRQRVVVP